MENLALIDSFSEFKDDKLIDRVTLMAILEDAFRNALKKNTVQMIILTSINPDREGDLEKTSNCCRRGFGF
jgi:N utilization substance protein A